MTFGKFNLCMGALWTLALGVVGCAGEPPTQASSPAAPAPTPIPSPASPSPAAPNSQGTATTLQASADTICLQAIVGTDARPDDIRITTGDGSVIAGLTASVAYENGQPSGWLATSFDRDSTPARLWLRATTGSLPIGEYVARVSVGAPTVGTAASVIIVVLTVRSPDLVALVVWDRSTYIGDLAPGWGKVTGPDLSCPDRRYCIAYVPRGSAVTLTAVTDSANYLFRWTDACSGTPTTSPCTLTVTDSSTAGAWFALKGTYVVLTMRGAGATAVVTTSRSIGSFDACWLIDGSGSTCGGGPIDGNRGEFLDAQPAFGSAFVGWSGDCSGSASRCLLPRFAGRNYQVTATFARDPAIGNVLRIGPVPGLSDPLGRGRITGPGIDCVIDRRTTTGACEAEQPLGATVTLTAIPDAGSSGPFWFPFMGEWRVPAGIVSDCGASASPSTCRPIMNGPRELLVGFPQ